MRSVAANISSEEDNHFATGEEPNSRGKAFVMDLRVLGNGFVQMEGNGENECGEQGHKYKGMKRGGAK